MKNLQLTSYLTIKSTECVAFKTGEKQQYPVSQTSTLTLYWTPYLASLNKKNTDQKKEQSLFTDNLIAYLEDLKKSTLL